MELLSNSPAINENDANCDPIGFTTCRRHCFRFTRDLGSSVWIPRQAPTCLAVRVASTELGGIAWPRSSSYLYYNDNNVVLGIHT